METQEKVVGEGFKRFVSSLPKPFKTLPKPYPNLTQTLPKPYPNLSKPYPNLTQTFQNLTQTLPKPFKTFQNLSKPFLPKIFLSVQPRCSSEAAPVTLSLPAVGVITILYQPRHSREGSFLFAG